MWLAVRQRKQKYKQEAPKFYTELADSWFRLWEGQVFFVLLWEERSYVLEYNRCHYNTWLRLLKTSMSQGLTSVMRVTWPLLFMLYFMAGLYRVEAHSSFELYYFSQRYWIHKCCSISNLVSFRKTSLSSSIVLWWKKALILFRTRWHNACKN